MQQDVEDSQMCSVYQGVFISGCSEGSTVRVLTWSGLLEWTTTRVMTYMICMTTLSRQLYLPQLATTWTAFYTARHSSILCAGYHQYCNTCAIIVLLISCLSSEVYFA